MPKIIETLDEMQDSVELGVHVLSAWKNQGSKRKIPFIESLVEFLTVAQNYHQEMAHLEHALSSLEEPPEFVLQFCTKIVQSSCFYLSLHFVDMVYQVESLPDAVTKLNTKLVSDEFKQYLLLLSDLIIQTTVMTAFFAEKKQLVTAPARRRGYTVTHESGVDGVKNREMGALVLKPTQYLSHLGIFFNRLVELSESQEDIELIACRASVKNMASILANGLHLSNERKRDSDSVEKAERALQGANTPKEKQVALIKAIANLNLNSRYERTMQVQDQLNVALYLKSLLVRVYPNDFSDINTVFTVLRTGRFKEESHFELLQKAFRLKWSDSGWQMACDKFNPSALSQLYEIDKDPLWVVLISLTPAEMFSDSFRLENKLKAYIDIIQFFYEAHLRDEERALTVGNLARTAIRFVLDNANNSTLLDLTRHAFKPSTKGKQSPETKQFGDWIRALCTRHAALIGQEIAELLEALPAPTFDANVMRALSFHVESLVRKVDEDEQEEESVAEIELNGSVTQMENTPPPASPDSIDSDTWDTDSSDEDEDEDEVSGYDVQSASASASASVADFDFPPPLPSVELEEPLIGSSLKKVAIGYMDSFFEKKTKLLETEEQLKILQQQLDTKQDVIHELQKEKTQFMAQVKALTQQLGTKEESTKELLRKNTQLTEQLCDLQQQLTDAQLAVKQAKSASCFVEVELDAASPSFSKEEEQWQQKVLSQMIALKQQLNGLTGFFKNAAKLQIEKEIELLNTFLNLWGNTSLKQAIVEMSTSNARAWGEVVGENKSRSSTTLLNELMTWARTHEHNKEGNRSLLTQ